VLLGRQVAPHAGAWIETGIAAAGLEASEVAPHAGAWIETLKIASQRLWMPSHPMRVRGLKQRGNKDF